MKMKRIAAIFALVVLAFVALPRGQQGNDPKRDANPTQQTQAPPITIVNNQPAPAPQAQAPANEPQQQHQRDWIDWGNLLGNWALVICAAWAASIAVGTLTAVQEQVSANAQSATAAKLTAELMRADQRPWVGPFGVTNIKVENSGNKQTFSATVTLKNFGRSPSLKTKHLFALRLWQGEMSEIDCAYAMQQTASIPVAPNTFFPSAEVPYFAKLELQLLENTNPAWFLVGRIEYQDVDGGDHVTTYALKHVGGTMFYLPVYNQAT